MKKNIALYFCILGLFSSSALVEAQSSFAVFSRSTVPPARLSQGRVPAGVVALRVDRAAMRQFRQTGGGSLALPMPDGTNARLTLTRFDLFTPNATITATGALGPSPIPMDLTLFRGSVDGDPGSWTVLSMSGDQVLGTVVRDGRRFMVSPATAVGGDHLVQDEAEVPARTLPFECGADDLQALGLKLPERTAGPNGAQVTPTRLQCDIAIDCDYEYYWNKFGGNLTTATNYITTVMAQVSLIYERDINVTIKIPYLNIWTGEPDPYTTATTGDRLPEFQNWWNANRTSVVRNLAHNISGRSLGGGIAYIGVVSSPGSGYGVSAIDANYSYPNNTTTWDVNVVAHEIGHNFNSWHTHSCNWQAFGYTPVNTLLDSCTTAEGGCYSGPNTVPVNKGTIMSYCHLRGPIASTIRMDFHPVSIPRMRAHAESRLPGQALQPPRSLVVTPGTGGAALTWTASPESGVLSYDIYRSPYQLDWNPPLFANTAGTSFNDLSIGTFYYKVRAVRAADQTDFTNEAKAAVCAPTAPVGPNVGVQPYALAQGDFNEDGIADLAVANFGADNVSIVIGQGTAGVGNGLFAAAVNYTLPGGSNPTSVAVGDFNEDGIADLAVTGWSTNVVQILPGQGTAGVGNGTFALGSAYPTASFPYSAAVADVNEDGRLDLVVACQIGAVSVLVGNGTAGVGNGTFAPNVDYTTSSSTRALALGDYNEDGILDVAVGVTAGAGVLLGQGASGVGNGTFAAAINYAGSGAANGIVSGDFNDDGIADLAMSHNTTNNVSIVLGQGASGVGNGTFAAPAIYPAGAAPTGLALGDWNQDGIEDIVVCNNTASSVSFLTGKGAAGIGNGQLNAAQAFSAGVSPRFVLVADVNENGVGDVIVVNADSPGKASVLKATCLGALDVAVTVVSPNGGESWSVDSPQSITWTKGAGVVAVNVELSRDGGANWEPLALGLTGTSYAWNTTESVTTQARVRVSDATAANHADASDANFEVSSSLVDVPTGPARLALSGVHPNPATTELRVTFTLPSEAPARLELLDLAGRRMKQVDVGAMGPGTHSVTLTRGARLEAGVYFVRLTQGGLSATKKAVFTR
jgi:hypothetical protein